MIYRCNDCSGFFDEPEYHETSYEEYYGVASMFPNSNRLIYSTCPFCGGSDFESVRDDEIDE